MNTYRYPHNLDVILEHMPHTYSASIGLWCRIGGRYENDQETGLSHFLEHMVFKGSQHRSCEQIKKDIEGIGGDINAFTSKEHTCFYAKVPAKYADQAIDVLIDIFFYPLLSPNDITQEKNVVIEEINMYLDSPSRRIDDALDQLLWNNHPLGKSLTGSVADVTAFDQNICLNFIKKYYQPINTVLSIAGNIKEDMLPESLKSLSFDKDKNIPSHFSQFIKKDRPLDTRVQWIIQDIEQTHLAIGFYAYSQKNPLRYALNILNIILGGNMSSRLFCELREKKGWVYEVYSSCSYYEDTGSFEIYAGLDSKKLFSLIEVVQDELKKIKTEIVNTEELNNAKEYYKGQLYLSLEKTESRMSQNADKLLSNMPLEPLESTIKKINSVTSQDIFHIAQDIFQKTHLVVVGISKNDQLDKVKKQFENFH